MRDVPAAQAAREGQVRSKQATAATMNARAWFLQGSDWHSAIWTLKPTSVLEEGRPVQLRWDFALPTEARFTDARYASLLESSRQLIALIRSQSLSTGLAQRAKTVAGYFEYLRELLRWMDVRGYTRFADLDTEAVLQFRRQLGDRAGVGRPTLAPTTIQKYLNLLTYLYRFGPQLDDGLQVDPFPGLSNGQVAGVTEAAIRRWPYTPDPVAVVLVQRAIDLVTQSSGPVLKARSVYAAAMAAAERRGCGFDACTNAANRSLQQADIVLPCGGQRIATVRDLARLIDMLYAACFVVISYLVGPRMSEILHLEAGCAQQRGEAGHLVPVIVGAIFKSQPEYHGRPHEWVAPPPAVEAIKVLEMLSAGHRAQAGRPHLWLRRQGAGDHGANEWQSVCPGHFAIPSAQRISCLLRRFAAWLPLPEYQGKQWKLSTHQGRKTFARFAALRDRSSLLALAQHLGHRERSVTDEGYSGSDYRLNAEIDAEILEQSVGAWEHMLASPNLGGRAGGEIMAKRPRFRGARLKQDIKSYARMLVDAGLTLGVCDWGFCVYREDSSACLGNAAGPNTARREPSTCVRCKNFAVSKQHRAYWVDQLGRHQALLNEPALPLQTLRLVRERMNEANEMVRQIDATSNEGENGQPIER